MKYITLSAYEELEKLHEQGFTSEITTATDGTEIILAKNEAGLTRQYQVIDIKE